MAHRAARPVTAGLSQLAQLDRRERARIVRQLCRHYPTFRTLLRQVSIARGATFASSLLLVLAVVFLVEGVSVAVVAGMVFVALGGFGYATVTLADSRFDLLLAVLGAHRTDELHAQLVTDRIYGPEQVSEGEHVPISGEEPVDAAAGHTGKEKRGRDATRQLSEEINAAR